MFIALTNQGITCKIICNEQWRSFTEKATFSVDGRLFAFLAKKWVEN